MQRIALRLDHHGPLVGDQLDSKFANEQAEPLPHANEQALDHADIRFSTRVEHHVALRCQLQVFATADGNALRRT
ncbi:hypothetical protein D3C71_1725560 [compost metagenome]